MINTNKANTFCSRPLQIIANTNRTNTASYLCFKFKVLKFFKEIQTDSTLNQNCLIKNNFIYVYDSETEMLNVPLSDFNFDDFISLNEFFIWENKITKAQFLVSKKAIYDMNDVSEFLWLVDIIKKLIGRRSKYLDFKNMVILDKHYNVAFKLFEFNIEARAILYKKTTFLCSQKDLSIDYLRNFGGLKLLMNNYWCQATSPGESNKFSIELIDFLKLDKAVYAPSKIDDESFYLKTFNECKYNTVAFPEYLVKDLSRHLRPYPLQVYEMMGWISYNSFIQSHLYRIKHKKTHEFFKEGKSIFEYYNKQGYNFTVNKKDTTEITNLHTEVMKEDNEIFIEQINKLPNVSVFFQNLISSKWNYLMLGKGDFESNNEESEIVEKHDYNVKLGNFVDFDLQEQNYFLKLDDRLLNFANMFSSNNHSYHFFSNEQDDSSISSDEEYSDEISDIYFDGNSEEEEAEDVINKNESFKILNNVVQFNINSVEENKKNFYSTKTENENNSLNDTINSMRQDQTFNKVYINQGINISSEVKEELLLVILRSKGLLLNIENKSKTLLQIKPLLQITYNIIFKAFVNFLKQHWSKKNFNKLTAILKKDLLEIDTCKSSFLMKSFSIDVKLVSFIPMITKLYFELLKTFQSKINSATLLFKGKKKPNDFHFLIEPKIKESIFINVMKQNYTKLIDQRLNSFFKCRKCSNKLCLKENLLSVDYTGLFGKCLLMGTKLFNVNFTNERVTEMITATYVVKDMSCANCGSYLGWVYVDTTSKTYSYKKNLKILEIKCIYAD
ncbi:hypothetical protein QEN19_003313 [Hanseniaspora menglaensis]